MCFLFSRTNLFVDPILFKHDLVLLTRSDTVTILYRFDCFLIVQHNNAAQGHFFLHYDHVLELTGVMCQNS